MPLVITFAVVGTGFCWPLATFSGRWLLTGHRSWLLRRSSRLGAYFTIALTALTTSVWIGLIPVLTWHDSARPPSWVALLALNAVWVMPGLGLVVAYALDRAGQRRLVAAG